MHTDKVEEVGEVADIMQVGTRNMQNYPLLEEVGKFGKPVMLKRHYGSSLRDWLGAAEYILNTGNPNVILCERGVSVPHTHRATSRFPIGSPGGTSCSGSYSPAGGNGSVTCHLLERLG